MPISGQNPLPTQIRDSARNDVTRAPTNASVTSSLAPTDFRHRLEQRRGRRTPKTENTQEIIAENNDPWEKRFAELNDKFLTLEKKQQSASVPTAVQFSITLTGSARNWYRQLKPNSISSFAELSQLFLTQFISGKRSRKPNTYLFAIKQESKESLKDYIARFNEEALVIEDYNDKIALAVMFSGLWEGKFTFSIGKNSPKTLAELVARAQKYTNVEEFSNARKNVQVLEINDKGKRPRNGEAQPSSKGTDDRAPRDSRLNRRPEGKFRSYTPLNTSAEQILLDIRGEKLLNWPICMRANPNHRDKRKYCRFHQDHGHNTADCVDLKAEIEALIRKGHLRRYTK
ncbi:uncharacterized protein LOC131246985 [Magnolia sinica]|uniref:uncharacterized protein LOC131246985 n=1 Tax=Magnolia sinica TaxID=86752 RepID=UPI002658DF9E|nr:uncharacterized protein LOC131246985 [Magnolia sinica]